MSDQQFDIIFRGDIVFGHQLTDVKLRLQQLFKADAAKVDALFSGRPVPLKRGLDAVSAQKYKEALTKAGAQVDLVSAGEMKTSAIAPVTSSSHASSDVASIQVEPTPRAPLTLAQRLAQQEAESQAIEDARENERRIQDATQHAANTSQPGWSLSPLGADLLQPTEKIVHEPRVIDTSAISLRPEGGNILDANEQKAVSVAIVIAPDFDVAEAGADLIRADEKMDLPLLEIELADWSLADLGKDLISESEKLSVDIPSINIPDVSLAPAGSDLGQLKPKIQAVLPDISGIRLAE